MKFLVGFTLGFLAALTLHYWWPWAERTVQWLVKAVQK